MLKRVIIYLFIIGVLLSCKTLSKKECLEVKNKPVLSINSLIEVENFEKEKGEIKLIVVDGIICNKIILKDLVFNNSSLLITSINAIKSETVGFSNGRVIFLETNSCQLSKELKKYRKNK